MIFNRFKALLACLACIILLSSCTAFRIEGESYRVIYSTFMDDKEIDELEVRKGDLIIVIKKYIKHVSEKGISAVGESAGNLAGVALHRTVVG